MEKLLLKHLSLTLLYQPIPFSAFETVGRISLTTDEDAPERLGAELIREDSSDLACPFDSSRRNSGQWSTLK